jgi:hypothetical protein
MLIPVRTLCVGGEAMVFAIEKSGRVGEKGEEGERGESERPHGRRREHQRKA